MANREDTYRDGVAVRLMVLNCTDKVIQENVKAIRSRNGRYTTTIPDEKSLLIAKTSNKKYRNNKKKIHNKVNQNDNNNGNDSDISYDATTVKR